MSSKNFILRCDVQKRFQCFKCRIVVSTVNNILKNRKRYIVDKDVQTVEFMFSYRRKKVRESLLPVQPRLVGASSVRNSVEAPWAKKFIYDEGQGIYYSSRLNCNRTH